VTDTHRLVFVAGLHRSGTTLLARCLAAHPAVSGLTGTGVPEDEGQHLQRVYPTARALGGPGRFALRPEAHLTEASGLVSDASRRALLEAWTPHWDLTRPVLVEKSPPNLLRTRFLQALFPEASFVAVIRHPAAVSLATRKWCHRPLPWLLRHWIEAHRTFQEDLPHLGRAHVVLYEDLVRAPASVVDGVFRFLDLEPADGAARAVRASRGNARYFERWERMRSGPLGPWVRWVERRYEPRVRPFGYSLTDLERTDGAAARLGEAVS
jgi:hypothetical protein